jgi:hypothetical protein
MALEGRDILEIAAAAMLQLTATCSRRAFATTRTMATRILADLALVTSALVFREMRQLEMGFTRTERVIHEPLNYEILLERYNKVPGLPSDK